MGDEKLNQLFSLSEEEGIYIEYVNFSENIQGLYYKVENCPPVIGINESITSDKKLFTCVLAEEIGHYFTTVGDTTAEYYSYRGKLHLNKQEIVAQRWATEYLLPLEEIVQAIKVRGLDFEELSEHLGVTRDFLLDRFKFLAKQQDYIKINDYTYLILTNLPNIFIYRPEEV